MQPISLVVSEAEGGDVKVLYAGRSQQEAKKVFRKTVDDGKIFRVSRIRGLSLKEVKRPAAVAKRRKMLAAERKEREAEEKKAAAAAKRRTKTKGAESDRTDGADGSVPTLPLGAPGKPSVPRPDRPGPGTSTGGPQTKTAPDKDTSS